jgi:predicted tellurium resistance membrane protein TerC
MLWAIAVGIFLMVVEQEIAMLELLADPQIWVAFLTLTALELVLGIDNIIFISILVDKLPPDRREFTRKLGLFLAMFMRLGLLLILSWIVGMTAPLFTMPIIDKAISGRDLVLILGGLFLLWKSAGEIHESLEGAEGHASSAVKATFTAVILQIIIVDMVFSLDSIITAVGMVDEIEVMMAAVIASVSLMMLFAGAIGRFVSDHPSIKMLALSFLLVIGFILVADGFGHHVPKGYVYSALAFSLIVETLNIIVKKRSAKPVHLHSPYIETTEALVENSVTRS